MKRFICLAIILTIIASPAALAASDNEPIAANAECYRPAELAIFRRVAAEMSAGIAPKGDADCVKSVRQTLLEIICKGIAGIFPPAPTEPAPTEPSPTEPAPTEPSPTEPSPTEPAPTEPSPTEPSPTEPAPTEPSPTEPSPTEPSPTEPTQPKPTEPEPTTPPDTTTIPEPTQPTSPPDTTEPTAPTTAMDQIRAEIIRLTNEERAKAGVPALEAMPELMTSAQAKAQDLSDNNYFDHHSPVYGTVREMIESFVPTYVGMCGENIISLSSATNLAQRMVSGWMNSPGHRENMLLPDYKYIGIGVFESPGGGFYGVQQFIGR